MRPTTKKTALIAVGALLVAAAWPAQAQTSFVGANPTASATYPQPQAQQQFQQQQPQPSAQTTVTRAAPAPSSAALMQNLQNPPRTAGSTPNGGYYSGDPNDPESAAYKADRLAKKAKRDRDLLTAPKERPDVMREPSPPPTVDILQNINQTLGGNTLYVDDVISKAVSADMRREAQREAALSYGARGGLAKRNYEIMENIDGMGPALDRVFNFRALLIRAPSGLLIEPPIVAEALDAILITDGGNEAAVSNAVYEINKKAKIVAAPRDWRQYLIQTWADVPPPPRVLWPRNDEEQRDWNRWVAEGWRAGIEQADQIFETNVHRISADYNGMVRYRVLLAQGMISAPFAMHEDRGVTGDGNQMRIGDSALRITGPSKFLTTRTEEWKPADR